LTGTAVCCRVCICVDCWLLPIADCVLGVARCPAIDERGPPSRRQRRDRVLLAHIKDQHRASLGSYGRPRMTEELKELGLDVGHRRVGRLMRQNAIQVIRTRKHEATTDSNHSLNISPNLLDREFHATGPNQKCTLIDTAYQIPGDRLVTSPKFAPVRAGSFWPSYWTFIPSASLPSVICTQIPYG